MVTRVEFGPDYDGCLEERLNFVLYHFLADDHCHVAKGGPGVLEVGLVDQAVGTRTPGVEDVDLGVAHADHCDCVLIVAVGVHDHLPIRCRHREGSVVNKGAAGVVDPRHGRVTGGEVGVEVSGREAAGRDSSTSSLGGDACDVRSISAIPITTDGRGVRAPVRVANEGGVGIPVGDDPAVGIVDGRGGHHILKAEELALRVIDTLVLQNHLQGCSLTILAGGLQLTGNSTNDGHWRRRRSRGSGGGRRPRYRGRSWSRGIDRSRVIDRNGGRNRSGLRGGNGRRSRGRGRGWVHPRLV